jgi:hypothetical protein
MWQSEAAMTITYANGMQVEGIVLARAEEWMRVAVRGYRDSVEFVAGPHDTWQSDTGEVVRIGAHPRVPATAEAIEEFICPQELAQHLVGTLDLAPEYAAAAIM